MMNIKTSVLLSLLVLGALPASGHAALALDSGTPNNSKLALALDASDFLAAEFSLGADLTISSIQAYINAGSLGAPGDTFTINLYADDGAGGLPGTQVASLPATFEADGLNGVANADVGGLAAGNYWVAFEVADPSNTAGLEMPQALNNGTVPALAYAFNAGSGYQAMTSQTFGVQVTTVPVPAALWLFAPALSGLAWSSRSRNKA